MTQNCNDPKDSCPSLKEILTPIRRDYSMQGSHDRPLVPYGHSVWYAYHPAGLTVRLPSTGSRVGRSTSMTSLPHPPWHQGHLRLLVSPGLEQGAILGILAAANRALRPERLWPGWVDQSGRQALALNKKTSERRSINRHQTTTIDASSEIVTSGTVAPQDTSG
ncbi:hypothetical protein K488DRAFT_70000 [Vararia minispora EC-137]|uniref:Uncharacterized protein n=1 Tax=Vararia minispora EC-137 TaxID=1314806 RepID=A0ACB8QNR0_9AGAM|nr:hypothetical protein K488DRAFT_70000 [Vararia minispora EC-137]